MAVAAGADDVVDTDRAKVVVKFELPQQQQQHEEAAVTLAPDEGEDDEGFLSSGKGEIAYRGSRGTRPHETSL